MLHHRNFITRSRDVVEQNRYLQRDLSHSLRACRKVQTKEGYETLSNNQLDELENLTGKKRSVGEIVRV